jgi:hypothetical protein
MIQYVGFFPFLMFFVIFLPFIMVVLFLLSPFFIYLGIRNLLAKVWP